MKYLSNVEEMKKREIVEKVNTYMKSKDFNFNLSTLFGFFINRNYFFYLISKIIKLIAVYISFFE